jgi:hypothetical protein
MHGHSFAYMVTVYGLANLNQDKAAYLAITEVRELSLHPVSAIVAPSPSTMQILTGGGRLMNVQDAKQQN